MTIGRSVAAVPALAEVGVRLRDDVTSRQFEGDVMVLDLRSNQYFAIGGSGSLIFEALRSGDQTEDDLVALLLARYRVDEPKARADVRAFVDRLGGSGLLQR
jgi:hypothetical protein